MDCNITHVTLLIIISETIWCTVVPFKCSLIIIILIQSLMNKPYLTALSLLCLRSCRVDLLYTFTVYETFIFDATHHLIHFYFFDVFPLHRYSSPAGLLYRLGVCHIFTICRINTTERNNKRFNLLLDVPTRTFLHG